MSYWKLEGVAKILTAILLAVLWLMLLVSGGPQLMEAQQSCAAGECFTRFNIVIVLMTLLLTLSSTVVTIRYWQSILPTHLDAAVINMFVAYACLAMSL